MRMAYPVPKDRVYIRSGYSSEPILCSAAARQCYVFQKHFPLSSTILDILSESLDNGLLDLGEQGELVARNGSLLLLVERDHPTPIGTPPFYGQCCRVITFIEKLFSEYAKDILDSVPNNVKERCR
ncbi:hypothetical protein K439DRAFT_880902 [Ramaria rubella]|nr:hypothetical protein K439DRAFT_880902 [Ramaria rubella]